MKPFPHPQMRAPSPARSGPPRRPPGGGAWRRRASQRGAFFISFALMLTALLGFVGMALDVAQIYNRNTELQNVSDIAALAAAAALVGTPAGIDNAVTAAATAARARKWRYVQAVRWNDAAISFGASPDASAGGWLDKDAAKASANVANLLFVRVDTGALDADHGLVATPFIAALGIGVTGVATSGRAVAGRLSIPVTPLGVCALNAAPAASRVSGALNELVEYGFRRGVGYDLLNLSSAGTTPLNFLIDPIDAAGTSAANFATAIVAPFICSGTMPMWRLPDPPATLHVQFPFPAATLSDHLNSRFNQYPGGAAPCDPTTAPPDWNVRSFLPTSAGWWESTPSAQTAASSTLSGQLATIADLAAPPASTRAGAYGVLWSFAPAAQWAATPPAAGYAALSKSNWPTLYPVNPPNPTVPPNPAPQVVNSAYPSGTFTPYSGGAFFQAPTVNPALPQRRVLNIPLLACPDAAGGNTTATVLAIGRFFMTAPASATAISAEFAGAVRPQALGGRVGLYP